ncbi:Aminopeptidase, T family [Alteracholeplasma palmae J233]|uniref:Aminopeptidase, T family n=1 Tax=Alteracholeplasma palmae (strain ATCC 49389 / J233) TaxID=1318466 RepID=U4KP25_ALTPJ|nr:aminopeptidase [Alteracholeplasma palmae]CCV63950.1 Aminopeptidase, T family [Alteracholeplasma palmae J233]
MPSLQLLEKYAKLAVKVGANVQKNQYVVIRTTTETKELTRLITKESYLAGAKKVYVVWADDYVSHDLFQYASVDTLEEVDTWQVEQYKHFVENDSCFISVTSPIPGLNGDIDPLKMQKAAIASQKSLSFFQTHVMGNKSQWTIVANPNPVWAKQVFPNLEENKAVEALWDAIFNACRVTESNDPVLEWEKHNEALSKHNKVLNDYNFKHLHFKNSLGTDLKVGLVKNHIWAGGGEKSTQGVYFNPNIPTEENFTMPDKLVTEGKVYSTKPLNYQGKLIDEFWLEFKKGKVVAFDAKKEKGALESLLNTDEGSRSIGEIALISHDSPISKTNILFLTTLFDENASCHMALGRAYPMNIKGGLTASLKELEKQGYNQSMVHVDFMFGSSDMQIIGTQYDGTEVVVFKDGNFVI